MTRKTVLVAILALLVGGWAATAQAGPILNELQAYYDFDSYTPGANPAGMPQGNAANEGSFADQSVNGNTAYAADVGGTNFVPHAVAGGKFGGAFYSQTPASGGASNGGSLAVVQNQAVGTFTDQSFTVAFWEKALFRSTTNSWVPGAGRSLLFAKGPAQSAIPAGTKEGYGLIFTQGKFQFVSNGPPPDNYFQGVAAQQNPHGNWDNGQWAHFAMTATYDGPNSEYDVQVYVNGQPLGGAFAGLSIPEGQMEASGFFTIGSHWRDNSWPHQRFSSWHLRPDNVVDGEAWIDDMAIIGVDLSAPEVEAIVSLGNELSLKYATGDVLKVLDAYRDGVSAQIGNLVWQFTLGVPGLLGEVSEVSEDNGVYSLPLDPTNGAGMVGSVPTGGPIPEPMTMLALGLGISGLGGYIRKRRRR